MYVFSEGAVLGREALSAGVKTLMTTHASPSRVAPRGSAVTLTCECGQGTSWGMSANYSQLGSPEPGPPYPDP